MKNDVTIDLFALFEISKNVYTKNEKIYNWMFKREKAKALSAKSVNNANRSIKVLFHADARFIFNIKINHRSKLMLDIRQFLS